MIQFNLFLIYPFRVLNNALLVLSIMCLSISGVYGQGYTIDQYDVQIDIEKDGVVHVQEIIAVDFNEKRRGIIRDIPLQYKLAGAGEGNAIIVENVEVVGDPFLIMASNSSKRIRIGSADKYLTGKKTYTIKYDVIGALEQFNGMAEFAWNVIGDEWDTRIRNFSVNYGLPYPIKNKSEDLVIIVKNDKKDLNDLKHTLTNDQLKINFDQKLNRRQGLSILMRFREHAFPTQEVPARVLAERFFIPKSEVEVKLLPTGQLRMTESHRIVALVNNPEIVRILAVNKQEHDEHGHVFTTPDLAEAINDNKRLTIEGNKNSRSYLYHIDLPVNKNTSSVLTFSSIIDGALSVQKDKYTVSLDLATFGGKVPVDTIVVRYDLGDWRFWSTPELAGYMPTPLEQNVMQYVRQSHLYGQVHQLISVAGVDQNKLVYPKEALFDDKMIDYVDLRIEKINDSRVAVRQEVNLISKTSGDRVLYKLPVKVDSRNFPFSLRDNALLEKEVNLSPVTKALHASYKPHDGAKELSASRYVLKYDSKFHANYELPVWMDEGKLLVPIYSLEDTKIGDVQVQAFDQENVKFEMMEHNGYHYAVLPLSEAVQSSLSSSHGQNFFKANSRLLLSLLLAGLLYLLWYRFGRDEIYDGSAQSMPPNYMTPAEAGYLWDGKLHGRDLISLIYHWAARGHLIIEEQEKKSGKSDYILEKIKELPVEVEDYERTLFDRLFTAGEHRVKISSLRESFYKTMTKAKRELKKSFEAKHMYEPFTRGIGILCVIAGVLTLGAGLLLLGLHASRGDFSWSLPIINVGMALILFGYYLPKKTALGSRYFIALQKFDKFIDDAPPEEIASLYQKDSSYFQNTLAFAIVLGKAKKWSEQFSDLVKEPPSYYRGRNYDSFSPILFTDNVVRGMRTMENDFYSRPAPQGGGTSTYSGGRSSSFGGGGFSSGGGFGGGGGSSW